MKAKAMLIRGLGLVAFGGVCLLVGLELGGDEVPEVKAASAPTAKAPVAQPDERDAFIKILKEQSMEEMILRINLRVCVETGLKGEALSVIRECLDRDPRPGTRQE